MHISIKHTHTHTHKEASAAGNIILGTRALALARVGVASWSCVRVRQLGNKKQQKKNGKWEEEARSKKQEEEAK